MPGTIRSARAAATARALLVLLCTVGALVAGAAPALASQLQSAGAGTGAGLVAARLANYLAATGTAGFLLAAVVLVPSAAWLAPAGTAATRVAGWVALLWAASAAALFILGLSNVTARALPEALQLDLAGRFSGTRFGGSVLAQGCLALAVAAVALGARTQAAAAAALTIAALAALGPAWWGHAGTVRELGPLALLSDGLHLLAGIGWVGGLGALMWLTWKRPEVALGVPVRRFSVLAGWAVLVLLASGIATAAIHSGTPALLTGTTWGRWVLVKGLLLVALVVLGRAQRARVLPRLLRDQAAGVSPFRMLAVQELGLMTLAFAVATAMSNGVPAEVEAASRVASVVTGFGDGQLNLTIDPAQTGANELHLYVLDDAGGTRADAAEATVTLTLGSAAVTPLLYPAGPGHWTTPDVTLPVSGRWALQIAATVAGEPIAASAAIMVR